LLASLSISGCAAGDDPSRDNRAPKAPPAVDWDLVRALRPDHAALATARNLGTDGSWPRVASDAKLV
jgi:hypothetical protein